MSDLLSARLASAKTARRRMSASERDTVRTVRAASAALVQSHMQRERVAHYERTVARMQSLMTEMQYASETLARHREGGCWTACDNPVHESVRVLRIELDGVFSTPILSSDCAPGGRFERMVSYHMRRIATRITIGSMLITGDDARDIVSMALVRAYSEPSALVEDARGRIVPTLGSMYRFARAELMRTVSRARREVATVVHDWETSERDMQPRNGAASLYGVDPSRIDWEDRDAVKAIVTPAPRWAVTPDASDMALADRVNRRVAAFARAERERYASERAADRAEAAERAAYGDDDTLGIDAACASLIASGSETLDSLAARLNVKADTLGRRLASLRVRPHGKGFRVVRIGSDGRPTRKAESVRDTRTVIVATRKRQPRSVAVVPFDAVPAGMRNAPGTVTPVPHMGDELEAALDAGNERVAELVAAVKSATAALRVTDSGAYAHTVGESAPVDPHAAAHKLSRCNCDAA